MEVCAMDWLCDDTLRQCLATVLLTKPMALSAVCKRWRAAQTSEFWKEVCIKRWPVVAKLPNCDHRAYFKQRIRDEVMYNAVVMLGKLWQAGRAAPSQERLQSLVEKAKIGGVS